MAIRLTILDRISCAIQHITESAVEDMRKPVEDTMMYMVRRRRPCEHRQMDLGNCYRAIQQHDLESSDLNIYLSGGGLCTAFRKTLNGLHEQLLATEQACGGGCLFDVAHRASVGWCVLDNFAVCLHHFKSKTNVPYSGCTDCHITLQRMKSILLDTRLRE